MSHLNTTRTVRIATRKSALALWQAEYVKAKLLEHYPSMTVELVQDNMVLEQSFHGIRNGLLKACQTL